VKNDSSPALGHISRFRNESLRLMYSKLDDARQNCLRIKSSLLSPSSGFPRSLRDDSILLSESSSSITFSNSNSMDSLEPDRRWEISRESGQVEEKYTDIHRDCFLSVPDMIRAAGYPCEEITVRDQEKKSRTIFYLNKI
jgi:hypothetical protein